MSVDRLRRAFRRLSFALGAALLVGWFLVMRPQMLGGPAAYVTVIGTSMQPSLQPGDLVVTMTAATYAPGDVVAYRVPDGDLAAGPQVIHRIVGGSADEGYILRGDNTNGPDLWRPRAADIVGRQWLVLPHAGSLLMLLRSPATLGAFAAALLVFRLPIWRRPAVDRSARGKSPIRRTPR
jgi:signal peptidase I